jgi:hypothetical protein
VQRRRSLAVQCPSQHPGDVVARGSKTVIPAKAGIQGHSRVHDSGASRKARPALESVLGQAFAARRSLAPPRAGVQCLVMRNGCKVCSQPESKEILRCAQDDIGAGAGVQCPVVRRRYMCVLNSESKEILRCAQDDIGAGACLNSARGTLINQSWLRPPDRSPGQRLRPREASSVSAFSTFFLPLPGRRLHRPCTSPRKPLTPGRRQQLEPLRPRSRS